VLCPELSVSSLSENSIIALEILKEAVKLYLKTE
jgi:hypothetical protein